MKKILGYILMVCGVFFGIYMGVWWAFIGGIIEMVNGVTATPVEAASIAWGLLRWSSAGVLGVITFYCFFFPGLAMLTSSPGKRKFL